MGPFHKILIANRGEIAVRILRTARKMGIKTVAVYASDDVDSLHVTLADEVVLLEGSQLSETYLNQEKLIRFALEKGAQAVHPGYGFLSENAEFAEKVERAGLVFIGATPEQIRLMGEKTQAIAFVKAIGIPVIPSLAGSVSDILIHCDELEFPLLVKASGGGGGKGMEVVYDLEHLPLALQQAQRQARQYFGNGELFVEKFLPKARHIEVQLMGDGKGNACHFFERECSIQRRYQKLIEEAPAHSVSPSLKEKLYEAALVIARSIHYRGAGTIEFLVDEAANFYFLEMNTRLQVEHPVTELITGKDLVEWQFKIAAGESFSLQQNDLSVKGHAFELRICAEDPLQNFRPTSGVVGEMSIPQNVRWDSFLQKGMQLSSNYDSLAGKLIIWGETRAAALSKLQESLHRLHLAGLKTNQEFLSQLLNLEAFKRNEIDTRLAEVQLPEIIRSMESKAEDWLTVQMLSAYLLHHFYRPTESTNVWKAMGYWRMMARFKIKIGDDWHEMQVEKKESALQLTWSGREYDLRNCQFNGSFIEFQINEKDIAIFISEEDKATIVQLNSKRCQLRSNHVANEVRLNKLEVDRNELKTDQVVADLFGKVVAVLVKPGDVLHKGQNLLVIESMKSEFTIQSPVNAVVKNIHVAKGHLVQDKELLVDLES